MTVVKISVIILLFFKLLFWNTQANAQKNSSWKFIVGIVISQDSIIKAKSYPKPSTMGYSHFYAIHHLKIVFEKDTLILAIIFNAMDTYMRKMYAKSFGLEIGSKYIFVISELKLCDGSFPNLYGVCADDGKFTPYYGNLIKEYTYVYRVINISPFLDKKKKIHKKRISIGF